VADTKASAQIPLRSPPHSFPKPSFTPPARTCRSPDGLPNHPALQSSTRQLSSPSLCLTSRPCGLVLLTGGTHASVVFHLWPCPKRTLSGKSRCRRAQFFKILAWPPRLCPIKPKPRCHAPSFRSTAASVNHSAPPPSLRSHRRAEQGRQRRLLLPFHPRPAAEFRTKVTKP